MTEKQEINCLGMKCPRPIIEIAKAARRLPPGSLLQIRADDLAFESDVKAWAENAEASILKLEKNGFEVLAELQAEKGLKEEAMSSNLNITPAPSLDARLQALETEVRQLKTRLEAEPDENMVSIICFSGEWDKLFAALTIASGSLAMDKEVHLFFTFWGLNALRCSKQSGNGNKSLPQTLLGRILPCGPGKARLSHLNFGGLGKRMMKHVMKKSGVDDIDLLFQDVKDLGAHFHVCDTTAELFGLQCTELSDIENMDQCGVATFLSYAQKSKMVLFI